MKNNNGKVIEILDVLYLRIMALHFNHRYIGILVCNSGIEQEFPDMCDGLLWMFSSDAYITIRGMFSNGMYTFNGLKNKNKLLKDAVEQAESNIDKVIPGFVEIRNKMFAHFNKKRNQKVAMDMFLHFSEIFDILTNLHKQCCDILQISYKDLHVYDTKTFIKMDEKFNSISDMMFRGFMSLHRDKLYSDLGVIPNNNFPLPKRFLYYNQHIPWYYRIYLKVSDFIDRLKLGKNIVSIIKVESEDKQLQSKN